MALGAVGSTTLLVTLFTGILIGMGAGVNVRVAHELVPVIKKAQKKQSILLFLFVRNHRSARLRHLSSVFRADAVHDEHEAGTY